MSSPRNNDYDSSARKYRAFICYSQQDRVAAERLHRRLENYRPPKHLIGREMLMGPIPTQLSPIFRDCDELAASSDIGKGLRDAIQQSQFLIVLCSPAAAQSRWVNAEIEIFRETHSENADRILTIILKGEPRSGQPETECFPPALFKNVDDTMFSHSPLAADLRPGRERHKDAELRLIAALLGISFDELKRRDHIRHVHRLQGALGLAAFVALTFAALAVFAFAQRAQARKSAARAIRARSEAEKLVDFMVVDLREKLEALGKLSLLEPANEQVRHYYETIASEEENAETLHHRGVALTEHGDDLLAKGDTKAAVEFYQAAKAVRERLTNLEPKQVQWRRYLAEIHGRLAETARIQNDLRTALTEQTSAMSISEGLAQLDPANAALQHDVGVATTQLGSIHIQSGKTDLAENEFRSALGIFDRILSTFPSIERKLEVIATLNQLGDTLRKIGKKSEAEADFRRAISLSEDALKNEPENAKLLEQLQLSYSFLSQVLAEGLRLSEALEERKSSLKINRQLGVLDAQNVRYQRGISSACVQIGELLCQQEKYAEAEPYVYEALAISKNLVAKHPEDKSCLVDLPTRLNHVSYLCHGLGRKDDALRVSKEAIEVRRKICAEDPTNREMKHWLGYDIYAAGSDLLDLHRPEEAEKNFRESIDIADELIAADPVNLVPLQFRALYELQLGAALREENQSNDSRAAYEQCLRTVSSYIEKGGSREAIHYPHDEAEKALKELHLKTAAK